MVKYIINFLRNPSEEYYSGGYYASPEDACTTYTAHALSSPYRNGEESRSSQMYRSGVTFNYHIS